MEKRFSWISGKSTPASCIKLLSFLSKSILLPSFRATWMEYSLRYVDMKVTTGSRNVDAMNDYIRICGKVYMQRQGTLTHNYMQTLTANLCRKQRFCTVWTRLLIFICAEVTNLCIKNMFSCFLFCHVTVVKTVFWHLRETRRVPHDSKYTFCRKHKRKIITNDTIRRSFTIEQAIGAAFSVEYMLPLQSWTSKTVIAPIVITEPCSDQFLLSLPWISSLV